MAATYNWSYKPGVANKYGITIASSADDEKPANAVYVAHWGNDETGNGSRMYPYRTLEKVLSFSYMSYIIMASGCYRPISTINITNNGFLVGDGNVIIELFYITVFCGSIQPGYLINIKFLGNGTDRFSSNDYAQAPIIDCVFDGVYLSRGPYDQGTVKNTVFKNIYIPMYSGGQSFNMFVENCTYYNCPFLTIFSGFSISFRECVFVLCNISGGTILSKISNSLFYQCNFELTGGGAGGGVYPIIPDGYTYYEDMQDLQNDGITIIGFPILSKSIIADPKFNNPSIGDYTLAFDSPAKNLSYFGTYVGAFSIATSLGVTTDADLSAFDNDSAVNLTIADNSLILTDTDVNGSIITKPIDNTTGRELKSLPTFGVNADRNGEYVDATADLASTVLNAGDTLSDGIPYLVEIGSITYDSNVYQDGERFTTLQTSAGTFTTATSGVVREILEAPARENIEARFTDGALTVKTNADALDFNTWYFVEGASVTYNGNTYAVGKFVHTNDAVSAFTGTGTLRKIFADADPFFYFEINQKPTSNNVGDLRTGDIVKGNGDKDFDRTDANVFPISKKFIQIKYTIQVNNLTP